MDTTTSIRVKKKNTTKSTTKKLKIFTNFVKP